MSCGGGGSSGAGGSAFCSVEGWKEREERERMAFYEAIMLSLLVLGEGIEAPWLSPL